MSTTINVTVGGNGLLDQSRQQMQAIRFSKLERDQDAKTTAEAEQQRQDQSTPLIGRMPQAKRALPEPAANRRAGGLDLLLVPKADYSSSFFIKGQAKNKSYANFTDRHNGLFVDGEIVDLDPLSLIDSGGPGNAAYLSHPGVADNSLPSCREKRPVGNNTWYYQLDAVLSDSGPVTGVSITQDGLGSVYIGEGESEKVVRHRPAFLAKNIANYTLEFFARPSGGSRPGDIAGSYVIVNMKILDDYYSPSSQIEILQTHLDWNWANGYHYMFIDHSSKADSNSLTLYPNPDWAFGSWHHIAIVKTDIDITYYADGKKIGFTSALGFIIPEDKKIMIHFEIALASYRGLGLPTLPKPAIHGFRFTPKALYVSDFTPAASIISFA